mmetsp:Transcript_17191/g.28765  ORF Transcript_17191/g.28765 Transcript_17191/m.28765 type:complete len:656 (-) Transcript_17191:190-2157(-)
MHHSSPMNLGTQCTPTESATQSYEETQVELDAFAERSGCTTEGDDDDDEDTSEALPRPWARLVSLSGQVAPLELVLPPAQAQQAPLAGAVREGLYSLGRGAKCTLKFKQRLISNEHCQLYCMRNNDNVLCPYIEDNSANGTFVNRTTRLMRGVRRMLHNGDLVSLVNPDLARPGGLTTETELATASFFVQICLPTQHVQSTVFFPFGQSSDSSGEVEGGGLSGAVRSATVMHLLEQDRKVFDYYDQKEFLGGGASGQVYRCVHRVDGHECALKVTNMRSYSVSGSFENPDLDRVLMEAHMIRALKHENIIHLEDVFAETNTLFLVMELVRGGDLFDRIIERGRYGEDDARIVMSQVLSAMQFMHDKNVAHRDMKPENILLQSRDSDVNVKITDFGLAKSTDDRGGLKTYCGTPQYFAPEVQNQQTAAGDSATTYGFAADMWSVGVVAFVLLTGDYPWSSDHGVMCQEIASCRVNFQKHAAIWASLSPAAKDFVQQLIVLEPRSRMTAAQAQRHPWLQAEERPLLPASPEDEEFLPQVQVVDEVVPSLSSQGGRADVSSGRHCLNTGMPPPSTAATRQNGQKGGKRKASAVEVTVRQAPQQGSARKRRVPSNGHAPMEISHTATTSCAAPSPGRSRLPRKAKQSARASGQRSHQKI